MDHAHDGNTLLTAMTLDNHDDDTSFKRMLSDYESDEESSGASPHSYPRLGIDTDNESDEESSNASPISCACPPGIPDEIQSLKPTRGFTNGLLLFVTVFLPIIIHASVTAIFDHSVPFQ
jgi:hypothetical protein